MVLRNGVEVRHASFADDMERLIRQLKVTGAQRVAELTRFPQSIADKSEGLLGRITRYWRG